MQLFCTDLNKCKLNNQNTYNIFYFVSKETTACHFFLCFLISKSQFETCRSFYEMEECENQQLSAAQPAAGGIYWARLYINNCGWVVVYDMLSLLMQLCCLIFAVDRLFSKYISFKFVC